MGERRQEVERTENGLWSVQATLPMKESLRFLGSEQI